MKRRLDDRADRADLADLDDRAAGRGSIAWMWCEPDGQYGVSGAQEAVAFANVLEQLGDAKEAA